MNIEGKIEGKKKKNTYSEYNINYWIKFQFIIIITNINE